jgi:hypothetical protein
MGNTYHRKKKLKHRDLMYRNFKLRKLSFNKLKREEDMRKLAILERDKAKLKQIGEYYFYSHFSEFGRPNTPRTKHELIESLLGNLNKNGTFDGGEQLLLECCKYQDDKSLWVVEVLVDNRVDVNVTDNDGNTPLSLLCKYPYYTTHRIVKLLIKHGAEIHKKNPVEGSAISCLCRSRASYEYVSPIFEFFMQNSIDAEIYNTLVEILLIVWNKLDNGITEWYEYYGCFKMIEYIIKNSSYANVVVDGDVTLLKVIRRFQHTFPDRSEYTTTINNLVNKRMKKSFITSRLILNNVSNDLPDDVIRIILECVYPIKQTVHGIIKLDI